MPGIATKKSQCCKRMKRNSIALVAALSFTAFSASPADDDESYSTYNRDGFCTYEHTRTYETFITRDGNDNITYQRTHYFSDDAAAKPTPFVPAATNTSHAARSATPMQTPVPVGTQAPVTVIEGPMTPEQIRRLVNGQ
jgi:hypothetical protein